MSLRRKKVELFYPAIGLNNPFAADTPQEQNVYPLSVQADQGLDLDYSALLLVDRLVVDRRAVEFVKDRRRPHLLPMARSLEELEDGGALRIEDYSRLIGPHEAALRERVQQAVQDPEGWLTAARAQWNDYKPTVPGLIQQYGGSADEEIERLHFGVYNHLLREHGRIDFREAARLTALLESRKTRLSLAESDALREVLKPLLGHVFAMKLLRQLLGSPFIDWQDLGPLYHQASLAEWTNFEKATVTGNMLEKSRELFTVALPQLRPTKASEVLAFMRKRGAVASLRAELRFAMANSTRLDAQWAERMRDQANRAQIADRKKKRVLSWFGLLGGGLPVGELVDAAETAIDLGADALEYGAAEAIERKGLAAFKWYYALLEAKNR